MSIELKKAAQDLLQALTLCRMDARLMHADDAQRLLMAGQALRTAIQQAEAQQPATPSLQAVCRYISDVLGSEAPNGEKHIARTIMHLLPLEQSLSGQQPATGEPVKAAPYNPTEEMRWAMKRIDPALSSDQCRALWSAAWSASPSTHLAPSVPKDDQIAALVNKVRDIARMFHDHQSLRERIAIELVPALKASQEVKSNAERWRYAIADGGNQSMNFIDIFDDWDGDGSFVEAFDKARLADKKEGSAA